MSVTREDLEALIAEVRQDVKDPRVQAAYLGTNFVL